MSFCTNCGNPVAETARFCSNCGTRIRRSESAGKEHGIPLATEIESRTTPNNRVVSPSIVPPSKTGAWLGRCKYCGADIPVGANPCPNCSHELKWVRRLVQPRESDERRAEAVQSARQAETIELAHKLTRLGSWDVFDYMFPFAGSLVPLIFFFVNPLWIVTSAIFYFQGSERLKKGEVDGARRSLVNGRVANWMMIFVGFIVWYIVLSSFGWTEGLGDRPSSVPTRKQVNAEREGLGQLARVVGMDSRKSARAVSETETIKSTPEKALPQPSPEQVQDSVEVAESEFLDMVKAFNTHSGNDFRDRQLREPYKNRRIVVSGRIMEVKEGFFAAAKIKMKIHGETVMAAFPSLSESTASRCNVGDYIKISGKPDLSLFYAIDMNDCKYLGEATPPPQKPRQSTSEFENELHQVFVDEIVSELLSGH